MKKNINSRNIPFTMRFGRNIAPFLMPAALMFTICVTAVSAAAQTSAPQDRKTFRYAVSLYDCGMYERAAEIFAGLAGTGVVAWDSGAVGAGDSFDAHINGLGAREIDFDGAINVEALGYYVLCAVKMQTRGYTVLANSYILKYPYGSLVPQIRFAHATICFDMGDYKGADSQLEPLSRRKLYHRQVPDFMFMKALSRLELGEEDAKDLFTDVINYKKSNRYVLPAHYFLGYMLYEEGNLAEAKDHFALAVGDPRFRELAEGYLVKCGGMGSQSAGTGAVVASSGTGTASGAGISAGATSGTVSASQTSATTASTTSSTAVAQVAEAATEAATATVTAVTAPTPTSAATTSENSATGEAAYNQILAIYDKGDFDEVEDLVLDFAESDDPNQYWLAKSFIILGDSYAEQGEFAKALATFESVRDGYNPAEPDDAKDDLDVRIKKAEEMLNKKR